MNVTLSGYEQMFVLLAGGMRRIDGLRKGVLAGSWDECIETAGAELAVAKATSHYWDGVVRDNSNIQVRWFRNEDDRPGIVREDADDALFVYVGGSLPNYVIHGAIPGKDGKQGQDLRPLSDFNLAPAVNV